MHNWNPLSWHDFPARQQPDWPDRTKLTRILEILGQRLPLVFSGEVDILRDKIAQAARGKMFLLQGGDCAERFSPRLGEIENLLRVLLQMNMVLMYAAAKPVIKVGRFAGQFAKPRSQPTETINGEEIPNYFGDIVNRLDPDLKSRTPNPKNLLDAYNFSASILNIVRGLSKGGFADLQQVHSWNEAFILDSPEGQQFRMIAEGISKALAFMNACGVNSREETATTDFYTSHEALVLDYESGLTRLDPSTGRYYDLSAHMLWLGDRTRQPDGAHVEFLRGIRNPVGIKAGPSMTGDDLCRLLDTLNPANESGRITLITRFGAPRIGQHLPSLIRTVKTHGYDVLWSCDPMHGNTSTTEHGYKTRDFALVVEELKAFLEIHKAEGTVAGGVHLELTGENVTECTGGAEGLAAADLSTNYQSACDPRLNARQALELAFLIAKEIA
ncbi:MAG TPA: 3-deoxy-7-phosphoheptulonate synthase class II [Spirochaetota bacterium]|nr:3-deoxy-7-phosphoheptulonate synthase class II [Spirochaetota bacterium]